MPNSITAGKPWIERMAQRLLKRCKHNAILDVGAGSGACADFLKNRLPDTDFTAVEVWEPYILPRITDRNSVPVSVFFWRNLDRITTQNKTGEE